MKTIAVYHVKRTNKVVVVLSGASCTTQIVSFEDKKDIPAELEKIDKRRAAEITGNHYVFATKTNKY